MSGVQFFSATVPLPETRSGTVGYSIGLPPVMP
ncbi:hypothetical protein EMIT0P12_10595 [Pseudomonas sp. IT-P12]